jgi:hypothetical protein
MRKGKLFSEKPVRALAITSILIILVAAVFTGCIPANVTQTVDTPVPPLTNLQSISPSRPKEPTATPSAASGPSVSPDADAVIPSPSGPPAPSPSESPSPSISPSGPPSPQASSSPSASPASVVIDLTSQNLVFDKTTITVPAGADVTIHFNNQDAGIFNNFSVYFDQAATNPIFVGDAVIGPGNATYSFSAPDQTGTYFFRSDGYPNSMTGEFIVQ